MLEDVNEMELEEVKGEEETQEPKKESCAAKVWSYAKKNAKKIVGVTVSVVTIGLGIAYVVVKTLAKGEPSGESELYEVPVESSEPIVDSDIQSNDVQ